MGNLNSTSFTFNVSLSVLDHLGRNLYRSFVTVLGEAISNSWDAGAQNIWIEIDREANTLLVKDDGHGMTDEDFQSKFLRIGYSKRKDGTATPIDNRPFIGRKGIGKLALLSCAEKISVLTKKADTPYVGGVIDNSGLSDAISDDLTPEQYPLEQVSEVIFGNHTQGHSQGTLIFFEDIKDGIRNTVDFIKKTVALYFRFSLFDESFNIYVNGEKVTVDSLVDLQRSTEFLWLINDPADPFVDSLIDTLGKQLKEQATIDVPLKLTGFVASVKKPRDLTIMGMGDRVSIDLFVNGRVRERDIIKHIPTSRITENYLYGQIHYDEMDDDVDRFTSSREGVVADDPMFKELLEVMKQRVLNPILESWDEWRRKYRETGDEDSTAIPIRERKSEELFNVVTEEYSDSLAAASKEDKAKVMGWIDSLAEDAKFNFGSYAECFVSENLLRNYINSQEKELPPSASNEAKNMKTREKSSKEKGNVNIQIRSNVSDLSYLSMDELAKTVEPDSDPNNVSKDAKQYKPIRDAVMHTSLLTEEAKTKLTSVFDNIKARVKVLLGSGADSSK